MTNPLRSVIQSAAGLGYALGCGVVGIVGTYKSRGSDPIPGILAMPLEGTARMRSVIGSRVREVVEKVKIPIQDNFPPAAGIMGDDIWTDDEGAVYRFSEDDSDPFKVVYAFKMINTRAKRSGQTGESNE